MNSGVAGAAQLNLEQVQHRILRECRSAAREKVRTPPGERLEKSGSRLAEWHPMLSADLHSLPRNGPDPAGQVDLRPLRQPDLNNISVKRSDMLVPTYSAPYGLLRAGRPRW